MHVARSKAQQQNLRWHDKKLERGIKHLCNNILHIIQIAGEKGWKHICIGSDFDGFINPVDICKNANQYKTFRAGLEKWLPELASKMSVPIKIPEIKQKVDDIMSGNAYRFLKLHFS